MKKTIPGDGPVIIKKYANRRLYNTETSSYITLEHLAAMTRDGRDFKVVDAKSEEDITHNILTQIIMEEEQRGQTMLPVPFLRQLIAMYGDSMQAMVPGYLEASMDSFRRNVRGGDCGVQARGGGWSGTGRKRREQGRRDCCSEGRTRSAARKDRKARRLSDAVLWWVAAAGAMVVAALAGLGDWRHRTRRDLDKVGWINWPSLQMAAVIAAVVCAIMAAHR